MGFTAQVFHKVRSMVRQIADMAIGDNGGNALPFPSMGLPDPLSVDPIAVTCATDEDDEGVIFPVTVAIGESALNGKIPPGGEE